MLASIFSKKTLLFLVLLIFTFILLMGCGRKQASSIPHPIEGKEDCLGCHQEGIAGASKMPHEPKENCTTCHQPE